MIAASPNWRSRSRSSVLLPIVLQSVAARFVETTVLPTPPFGEKTVITRPRRPSSACCARRPWWQALRMAKTMFSVSCGSGIRSATPSSSASSSKPEQSPEASTMTGARVYSRIAASSSAG